MQLALFLIALCLGTQLYLTAKKSRLARIVGILVMIVAAISVLVTGWMCLQCGAMMANSACAHNMSGTLDDEALTTGMPAMNSKGYCPFAHKSPQEVKDEKSPAKKT